jgi:hypothetical protein
MGYSGIQRAVVVSPRSALDAYLQDLRALPQNGAAVREIDLVALEKKVPGRAPIVPRELRRRTPAPKFEQVKRINGRRFTMVRFRSNQLVRVTPRELLASRLGDWPVGDVSVLLEPGH